MAFPTRVLVVDDHETIVRGLVRLLEVEPDIEVAGTATNGQEAVALAQFLKPDVVVLDVKMPVLDGIKAGRAILDSLPSTKLLMISSDDEDSLVQQSLAMGASGFLAKHCSLLHVPVAIRQIVSGVDYLCLASSQPASRPAKSIPTIHS
jgi:two-component system nitrate/nitrite response regulator NarL